MSIVTVSPKFQVVIPRQIREALGLEPGQKVQAFEYEGRVEFIPLRPAKALRGFLRGLLRVGDRAAGRTRGAYPESVRTVQARPAAAG